MTAMEMDARRIKYWLIVRFNVRMVLTAFQQGEHVPRHAAAGPELLLRDPKWG